MAVKLAKKQKSVKSTTVSVPIHHLTAKETVTNDDSDYLFYIKNVESNSIKVFIEVLKNIILQANLFVTSEGLTIYERNTSSESVIIHARLNPGGFDKFIVHEPTVVGVEIPVLAHALKSSNRNQSFALYMKRSDPSRLYAELVDEAQGLEKLFEINTIDLNQKVNHDEIPINLTSSRFITIPSSELQRIVKDMKNIVAEHLTITIMGNKLQFSGVGQRSSLRDTFTMETKPGEQPSDHAQCIQKTFRIDHFLLFVKSSHLSERVQIYASEKDQSMVFVYNIKHLGELTFYP